MGKWEDDLDDAERLALAAAAKGFYDRLAFPLAPDVAALRSALTRLGLLRRPPMPEPSPRLKPPSVGSNRRGGRRR